MSIEIKCQITRYDSAGASPQIIHEAPLFIESCGLNMAKITTPSMGLEDPPAIAFVAIPDLIKALQACT